MILTRVHSGICCGVMFFQLPPSRVSGIGPSSDPVQIVSLSRRDGATVKMVE
jgi:hypothetical protein